MHEIFYSTLFLIIQLSIKTTADICCTPDQWEAFLYLDNGQMFKYEGINRFWLLNGTIRLSYDYTNHISYVFLNGTQYSPLSPDPHPDSMLYLYDYKNGVEYDVNGGKCDKSSLVTNMTRQCVPDNGKITNIGTIGPSNVKTFSYDIEVSTPVFIKLSVTVMADSCTPLHVTYYTHYAPDEGIGFVYNVDVIDTSIGIKDRSIFDVPEPCKHLETKAKKREPRSIAGAFLRDGLIPRV